MPADRPAPAAPEHLSASSKALYNAVLAEFDLSPAELRILVLAVESLDIAEVARQIIEAEGPVVTDRFGQTKPQPAVKAYNDAASLAARLLRQLGVEAEEAN